MTSSEQIQEGFQDTRYSLLCCKYKVNNYYYYYLKLNQLVSNLKQKSINDSVNDQTVSLNSNHVSTKITHSKPTHCKSENYMELKAGTHEGACSRSTFLQHAPGAKLPRLHQRFLAKKYVAQQNVCSRVLLPHIKLV